MTTTSPTARTLHECRKRGWSPTVVERRIRANVVRDAFGFGDVLALDDEPGSLMIQATSDDGGNVRARVRRVLTAKDAKLWLERGNRIQVWGWGKRGPRGKAKRWRLRVVHVALIDGELGSFTDKGG